MDVIVWCKGGILVSWCLGVLVLMMIQFAWVGKNDGSFLEYRVVFC